IVVNMFVLSHNKYSIILKVERKMSQKEQLETAQKGAFLSLIVYMILSVTKFIVGYLYDCAAVKADSLNNMTDIIVSLAVIIVLKISIKPADQTHPYGHLKSANTSSSVVSFIIILVVSKD